MPKHQSLQHLGLETERTLPEQAREDFRHRLLCQSLDMRERPEVDRQTTALDNLLVVKRG
jgi:hypothetical protein